MDITELRARAARVGDRLAALSRTSVPGAFHAPAAGTYADGVQDVARWLTTGVVTVRLRRLLDAVERQTPGGDAPG